MDNGISDSTVRFLLRALVLVLLPAAFAMAQPAASIAFSPVPDTNNVFKAQLSYYCPADATTNFQRSGSSIAIVTFGNCLAIPPPGPAYTQPIITLDPLPPGTYQVTWAENLVDTIPILATASLTVNGPLLGAPLLGLLGGLTSVILLILFGTIALKERRG